MLVGVDVGHGVAFDPTLEELALLAQTWDPAVLGTPDARSIIPDPAKARDWYRKAARFGSQDAQQRLSQMQN